MSLHEKIAAGIYVVLLVAAVIAGAWKLDERERSRVWQAPEIDEAEPYDHEREGDFAA